MAFNSADQVSNSGRQVFILFGMFFLSGCSLFFGNIKPTEERSTTYGIEDLSLANHDWVKVTPESIARSSGEAPNESADPTGETQGIADAAFQSKKTASIISINSVCRGDSETGRVEPLRSLTRELLLGVSDISLQEEKDLVVAKKPALETTVRGKIDGEEMVLMAVVLQQDRCVYDLMYVSRPQHFEQGLGEFRRFSASLKFK